MMHPLVYYISQSTTDENNKALAARPGISSMERCPSGLRCMIGNHVDGEYRHGGSNPPLSATAEALSEMTELFSCFSGERAGYSGRGSGSTADIISLCLFCCLYLSRLGDYYRFLSWLPVPGAAFFFSPIPL